MMPPLLDKLRNQLEPATAASNDPNEAALLSIAISLKRLADSMEIPRALLAPASTGDLEAVEHGSVAPGPECMAFDSAFRAQVRKAAGL